jgi:hypothetical protein
VASADYLKNNSGAELLLYQLYSFYRRLGGPWQSESSGGAHNVNVAETVREAGDMVLRVRYISESVDFV